MQLKTTTTASLHNTLQTCTCTSISRESVGSKWITDEANTVDNGPHIGKKKIIKKKRVHTKVIDHILQIKQQD